MEGNWLRLGLFLVALVPLFLGCQAARNGMARGTEDVPSLCSVFVLPLRYPCEEHTVVTEDGYVVAAHRIPYGLAKPRNASASRPAVYLQHGLLQGGDTWLLNSPDESLGFVLADAGFDVWIGSGRGTVWSPGHKTLSKKDKAYWDWTWDELASYDVPAILEYINKTTASSKIFYVGHSQGTIIGLAALTNPKVSDMVAAAALLSPISYLDHISSKFLLRAAFLHIDTLVKLWGFREFNLYSTLGVDLVDRVCASPDVDCGNLLAAVTGPNCCFNSSRIPYYLQYEPQPTSLKNMQHLAQMIRTGSFSKFDYGFWGNLRHYLRSPPPEYDLSTIPSSFPLWMAYGGKDCLSDTTDVLHTLKVVTCNPKVLYLQDYAHLDFVLSTRAKEDLYNDLIAFFLSSRKSYSSQ